jgi:hypothetical protein
VLAARAEAWEAKHAGSVRRLLADPRWEKRFVRFLELSGVGRTLADGTEEESGYAARMEELGVTILLCSRCFTHISLRDDEFVLLQDLNKINQCSRFQFKRVICGDCTNTKYPGHDRTRLSFASGTDVG